VRIVFSLRSDGFPRPFTSGSQWGVVPTPTFGVLALILLLAVAVAVSACSRSKRNKAPQLSKRVIPLGQPVPKGGGRYKVGEPYQVNGRWYYPRENTRYDRVGIASWYGEKFHGRYTANGEIFDMNALTAAHPTLPMPVYAEVTNLSNGRSIVVRINDRGPYARGREIDLSRRSAQALGIYRHGTAKVRVRYLGKAPLNGDDSYERRVLASKPWGRKFVEKATAPRIYARAVTETVDGPRREVRLAAANPNPMTVASIDAGKKQGPASTGRKGWQPAVVAPGGPLHFVQAGSFRSKDGAERMRESLKGVGEVSIYPAEIRGRIWYRVRLGPYRERLEARKVLARAVEAGARGAAIIRN